MEEIKINGVEKFTGKEIEILAPYIKLLKQHKIFQTSDIIKILNKIPNQTEAVKQWKSQVQLSVFSGNKDLYNRLLNQIE